MSFINQPRVDTLVKTIDIQDMTDEKILEEIRKYRKLSRSTYAKDACSARRKADSLMKAHGVKEEEL